MTGKRELEVRGKIVSSIVSCFVVGAAFFSPAALAQTQTPVAASASQAVPKPEKPIPPRGTLYRVTFEGNTAYLFGTIHIGRETFYPLEPRVTEAFDQSSKLVMEIDPSDDLAIAEARKRHAEYAGTETLRDHVSTKTLAMLQKTLKRLGIPLDKVMKIKPWAVANFLELNELERQGYQEGMGVEFYLLAGAKMRGKAVVGLEDPEFQMGLFDGMPPKDQEQYLRETLRDLADGTTAKKGAELMKAWGSADENSYRILLRESLNDKTQVSEFTRRVLMDQRNPQMANKIEALLQHDKNVFVGVGLLHLLGESGVPALLQQRGYRVEKLY